MLRKIFIIFLLILCSFTPAFANEKELDYVVSRMSLEERIGQMFMPTFYQIYQENVTELSPAMIKTIQKYHLGGIILAGSNIKDIEQVVKLVEQTQSSMPRIPLFIAADQEGGQVVRSRLGTRMPCNMALGATRSPDLARQVGQAIGEELKVLGINVNLAPVLDIVSNPDNPIGIRSFGGEPQLVADLGTAYIQGLNEAGVIAAAKHFPGHGNAPFDSHFDLPVVLDKKDSLLKGDLHPFQQAINQNMDMMMTAHVAFPGLDGKQVKSKRDGKAIFLPATLSYKTLTQLARKEMGFRGVFITDAMNMRSITQHFGEEEAVILAVKAGLDIICMPKDLNQAYQALIRAVKTGVIPEERINQSVKRIISLKLEKGIVEIREGKFVSTISKSELLQKKIEKAKLIVGCEEHRDLERLVAEKAVTLLKNQGGVLPLNLKKEQKVLLFAQNPNHLKLMEKSLKEFVDQGRISSIQWRGLLLQQQRFLPEEYKKLINWADYIILGSYKYNLYGNMTEQAFLPECVLQATEYSKEKNKPLVLIAISSPYDISYLPKVHAYLTGYGVAEEANISACMSSAFGIINPVGRLPVWIPNPENNSILYSINTGLSYNNR